MSHYYANDPESKSNIKEVGIFINDQQFKFYTDSGVFSKKGLDYGTRSLLKAINLNNLVGNVLDFGCGYGPIGIYVAKNTDCKVDMIDINNRSINLAIKNASINDVNVNIFNSDKYENVNKKYNFIITNPPIRVGKKILYEILFGAFDHLVDDGELWFVINKDQGAKSLVKDMGKEYKVEVVIKDKGFYVIRALKH